MTEQDAPNHRTLVAQNRRIKTRRRLIASAFKVFAQKGVEASVIDDVISVAGLSRGTFYNYFQSNEELLVAVNDQLREELIATVKKVVSDRADSAERIALSIGLLFRFARQNPVLAQFVAQIGFQSVGSELLLSGFMGRAIQDAIDDERFVDCQSDSGLDLLSGAVLLGLVRLNTGGISDDYVKTLQVMVLRGLGLDPQEAERLSGLPLPDLMFHPECALIFSMANRQ